MDKTDRLRDYGLAFLLYEQGLGICGYELIRELFIFIKLILNSYLFIITLRVVLYCIMPFLLSVIFTLGILVLEVFQVFRQLCPEKFFLVHTLLYFGVFRHKLHV